MTRFFCRTMFIAVSVFYFLIANISANAQNHHQHTGNSPMLRRAVVLDIEARVLETEQVVVWKENHRKVSIPGVPVGIQLAGSNIVVAVQFTPYISRSSGNVLVTQGQIWVIDQDNVTYFTSIQTVPLEFGEPIYFFPLGSSENLSPSIEIVLTVNLYNEAGFSAETTINP